MKHARNPRSKKRGSALVTTLGVLMLLSIAAVTYVDMSTQTLRTANHNIQEVQATNLCEAGTQSVLRELWRPFRESQKFTSMTTACNGATPEDQRVIRSGEIGDVGRYVAGVVAFTQVNPYLATVTIRSVGYRDLNENDQLDDGEPFKEVQSTARYELSRSRVFDYTYFVNNYGWMDGFQETWLIVNGDMRANGNFDFLNGSPTVNGTVVASSNQKLIPPANGFINQAPVKWSDSTYTSNYNNTSTPYRERWRQPYDSSIHGLPGSSTFENWRNYVFFSNANWVEGHEVGGTYIPSSPFGSVLSEARGTNNWSRTSTSQTPTLNMLDPKATGELAMPDLSDLTKYQQLSQQFSTDPANNQKATFLDGTANPDYGQPAYVKVWNSSTSSYQTLTDANGYLSGSAVMVGTSDHPILVYGPVTVSQDIVIKGYVKGQGTLYAGRNVHVVGSVRYKNGPNFQGNNPTTIEQYNEKRDLLGLAARGSVITGNPTTFSNPYPLKYMTPPFTKPRKDYNGNVIAAFDATQTDETGRKRYQSVVADGTISSLSEGVNCIDAILYTNFVGGGNIGIGGGGIAFNGTLISKDEALVAYSLPLRMNYDSRIRERGPDQKPLIDINLPRQPVLIRSTWQDKGYSVSGS